MNNTNSPPPNLTSTQNTPVTIPYVTKDLEMTFTSSLIHSFLLIFFAELGDKTFIMLIIMQLRTNKATIFFSSIFAELLMNYIAIFVGRFLDLCLYKNLIEYLCIMFYLIYGLYIFGTGFTEKKETFESELSQIERFNRDMCMDVTTLNETKIKKVNSLPISSVEKKYNLLPNFLLFFLSLILKNFFARLLIAINTQNFAASGQPPKEKGIVAERI